MRRDIRNQKIVKNRPRGNRYGVDKIKIMMIIIPIAMAVVLVVGIWFALREYNSKFESVNVSLDSSEIVDEIQLSSKDLEKLLTLVSSDFPLPSDYELNLKKSNGIYCDELIVKNLERMLKDAKAAGIDLVLTKGYIDAKEQDELYQSEVQRLLNTGKYTQVKAEAEAKKQVPPGNYSEYQTGLIVDLNTKDQLSSEEFASSAGYTWLNNNSINYGFILRYPKSKEKQTGLTFSPVSYRYVGVENAKKIRATNMSFDEYWEYIHSR